MKQEMDETTQQEAMVIIEHKEDLHPQIIISDDSGEVVANYPIPSGAHIVVNEGDKIVAGTLMARTPRKTAKTKDIPGGRPPGADFLEPPGRRTRRKFRRSTASWTSVRASA